MKLLSICTAYNCVGSMGFYNVQLMSLKLIDLWMRVLNKKNKIYPFGVTISYVIGSRIAQRIYRSMPLFRTHEHPEKKTRSRGLERQGWW